MMKAYFELSNQNCDLIKGDLRVPVPNSITQSIPLIIFSHGFKGFRNWSFIPFVCESFANSGFCVINFDFSLNGIIDDINQVYDDTVFRRNKVSTEVDDLSILLQTIITSKFPISNFYDYWNGEIYLAGHSLGGAVSILCADKYEEIKKISLWASISNLDRNTQRQKDIWKDKGATEIVIASTGQKLSLDFDYIVDKDTNYPDGALIRKMSELVKPVQIIHPENDLTVKIKEAYDLKSTESINRKRILNVIERAGHTFNSRHPFGEVPPEPVKKTIRMALDFLK